MSFSKPKTPAVTPAPQAAPAPATTATAPVNDVVNQTIATRKKQSTLLASSPTSAQGNTLLGSPIK
jgi:hypothetical protein